MATTGTAVAISAFDQLTSHLKQWFYQPDIEALEITLAVAASHYVPGDPTWIFIVGPPATGKTSALIQAVKLAPKAYITGDLTPQTFLSAKRKKGGNEPSLLTRLENPIFLMKDFTTMISKRPDDRAMIVSQLREIYDGVFTKDTGESGRLYWQGKCTVIAACTPAIEREWAMLRDLGERFMTVRWHRESGVLSAKQTMIQRSKEAEISQKTANLGRDVLALLPHSRPELEEHMIDRICALAEIVALSRNRVIRDSHADRQIIDVPAAEGPNRIAKALASVCVNYAALFNRDVYASDIRLATRLAMNSIPSSRYRIISSIPCNTSISWGDLKSLVRMPASSLEWHIEELMALTILQTTIVGSDTKYEYTPEFRDLWSLAFPSTT